VSDAAAGLPGLDAACRALAAGRPVVLPNATPLAYIVVATKPHEVNRIKGRPLGQNVGITLHDDADWRALQPALDLEPDGLARMRALMRRDLLSFLAPVRDGAELPTWIRPAMRGGWLGLFAGCWRPLGSLWERFPRLFGSSANRTGRPPAASAGQAAAVFGHAAVVVDGDAQRDAAATRGATTILRIAPDGTLALHRSGAHDAGLSAQEFLRTLDQTPSAPPCRR
jgi:L-threonylcarbamoyladenylate synthase